MGKKTIYQGVVSIELFLVKEFKDFKSANQVECIFIIKKMYVETHTIYSGNKYEIYNYTFFDKNQKSMSFFVKKWSIEEIYDGYFGSQEIKISGYPVTKWSDWNDYLISDPNGELRRLPYTSPKEAISNLVLFSKYQDWAEYELENK